MTTPKTALYYFKDLIRAFNDDDDKNWASYVVLINDFNEISKLYDRETALKVLQDVFPDGE